MKLDIIAGKLEAFGFLTKTIDGHNYNELLDALMVDRTNLPGKPLVIIANTIKGKGIPFLEHKEGWHGRKPTADELSVILKQLDMTANELEEF
jgi:transketolase